MSLRRKLLICHQLRQQLIIADTNSEDPGYKDELSFVKSADASM